MGQQTPNGYPAHSSRLLSHPSSLDSLVLSSAQRHGMRPALTLWGQTLTYGELNAAVDRFVQTLSTDIPPASAGTRIGILAPNVPALVIALLAVWRSGAVAVPLNARLREYEIDRILRDAEVAALVSVTGYRGYSFTSLLSRLLPNLPALKICLFVTPTGEVETTLSGATNMHVSSPEDLSGIAALLYTSGTTGTPKGALVSHAREMHGANQMSETLGLTPADVCTFVVPISHAFGLTCLLSALASGCHCLLVESTFSPEPMLESMRESGATILNGSPSLLTSFLKAAPAGIKTLRGGFVAGSACPSHLLEDLDDMGVRMLNLFGMTEIGAAACCRHDDPPVTRYTTSGHPLPGYEFRTVPAGATAEPETGEIQVRGPYVTPGYYRQPEQTAQAFLQTGDGKPYPWFRTGDLGSLDEAGTVRISGRAKEVVQVGGLNVFPAEVEGFLTTHPDVSQAAVVGVPHPTMGEVLEAYVVPRAGSNLQPPSILQFARARIAGYKLPYAIHIVPELPLLASGKPDRAALLRSRQGSSP